jgi:hypothetical protein
MFQEMLSVSDIEQFGQLDLLNILELTDNVDASLRTRRTL